MKKSLWLLFALASAARSFATADGMQTDGIGSPPWFSWIDFAAGCGSSWVIVGPMFIYWAMKRAAGSALG